MDERNRFDGASTGVHQHRQGVPALFQPQTTSRLSTFQKQGGRQSSYHCVNVRHGDNWIKVPKLKAIKARIHCPMDGKLKSITLSRTVTGKHYAALLFETEQEAPAPLKAVDTTALSASTWGFLTSSLTSSGRKTANSRFLKQTQKNLKRKQQALLRKQKGSARRAKARLLVAKAHERVVNARKDFQDKLSRQIVDDKQAVIVETLKVQNMIQ